ncbi:TM2 domain-containing protein almondex-like [Ctenocephalides felis]|uniref:TM2 domain-containing protein almondex-like n=1 Tax=Ctenocephalides felis TaxID=7515 RepID=UPI000E6E28B4|nr:TM2 domain-containing protein almondex-like [Ctenocephalides felis]
MACVKLNIKSVIIIVLVVMFNGIKSHMAVNHMEGFVKDEKKNFSNTDSVTVVQKQHVPASLETGANCSRDECYKLLPTCLDCKLNDNCTYGAQINVSCTVRPNVDCHGNREFFRVMTCQYCHQTEHWEHTCAQKANCNSIATPKQHYRTNCTVNPDVLCLGKRNFLKNVKCDWTGGYHWSTALILSITLGGFGADRFYLGHWQEGIGKLFSFGGLGVWTLIDVILISLHYLGPADGSLFL